MYSANAPFRYSRSRQRFSRPALQYAHRPQGAELATTTRSPRTVPAHPGPQFLHRTRELVPERRRHLQHPRMSAPPEHLHVRPAGGSRPNPHQQLPLTGRGHGLFPYFDMLGAEQVYDPVFHVHGGGAASGSNGLALMRGERQTKVAAGRSRLGQGEHRHLKGSKGMLV